MSHSFHPYPIITAVKTIILVSVLAAILFVFRESLSEFFLLLVFALLVFGVLRILSALVVANTYAVTLGDEAITYSYGILNRRQYTIPYYQVTEASYSQSIFQRFFGVGNLNIDTPGGTDMVLKLADVRYNDIERTLKEINTNHKKK